jgi:hypothetical protein
MPSSWTIDGHCDPRFASVRDAFAAQIVVRPSVLDRDREQVGHELLAALIHAEMPGAQLAERLPRRGKHAKNRPHELSGRHQRNGPANQPTDCPQSPAAAFTDVARRPRPAVGPPAQHRVRHH